MSKRLVLVGGGHAHLFVLEALAQGQLRPNEAVLLSAYPQHAYSGMMPGFIGGRYRREEVEFDLAAIARRVGTTFVEGTAIRIDAGSRVVTLADGRAISYDVASFAVGSEPAGVELPGVRAHALFLKPIQRAVEIVPALERAAREAGPEPVRALIVGGGLAGVEVGLAVRRRLDRLGTARAIVTIIEAGHELMADRSPAAAAHAQRALGRGEVSVRLGTVVTEVGAGYARLASGAVIQADVLIWASGATAPDWFRASGLPVDSAGFLLVDDTLRSVGAPEIFAAGDAAAFRSHPRTPKAGVYAVRAGPVLAHNIGVALGGAGVPRSDQGDPESRPYRVYRPQRRFLALVNTGDGRAMLSYGPFAITSRWAMALKDRIDRGFMKRFQGLGLNHTV